LDKVDSDNEVMSDEVVKLWWEIVVGRCEIVVGNGGDGKLYLLFFKSYSF
jgi:hypothetical protein